MTCDVDFAAWWDALGELHIDMAVGTVVVLFFSSVLNHLILITSCGSNLVLGSSHKLDNQGRNVRSTTAPSNVTAGIALPAALLSKVHHSVCALFRSIKDPVSWHHWDTFPVVAAQLWLPPGCPCRVPGSGR